MELLEQVNMGESQMKAAILGGHDLSEALVELCQMANTSNAPHAVAGGIGCLLFCVEVIDRSGLLPAVEKREWHEFLHGGHAHRVAVCAKALNARDFQSLGPLTTVLIACIQPHRSSIKFNGRVPILS